MKPGFKIKLTDSQLHGAALVAFSALFVPAILFFYREYLLVAQAIPFGDQYKGSIAVEIDGNRGKGIYFLSEGKRLNDLLTILCLNPMSIRRDPANLDLFMLLKDGFKITVLRRGNEQSEVRVGRMTASTRLALDRPVDINSALLEDLVLVPGIGEKTADKVIEARNKRGKFRKLEDMMKIKGIKQKRLEKLRPYLYVKHI